MRIFFRSLVFRLLPTALLCTSIAYADNVKEFIGVGKDLVNGFSGLTLGENGHLYVTNGLYKNVLEFDPQNKKFVGTLYQSPNFSFIDDIVNIPHDDSRGIPGGFTMTGFLDGRLPTVLNDGTILESNPDPLIPCAQCGDNVKFDPNLLTVDPIAYRASEDRLYVAVNFNPTRIFKLDWRGTSPLVQINLTPPTSVNAFSFGPDGFLYAPVPAGGRVVKIDVSTGIVTTLISGLVQPIAVKVDNQGKVFVVSRTTGKVSKFDPTTNTLSDIATLEPALDNLVIDNAKHLIYVTNDQNQIYQIDLQDQNKVKRLFTADVRGPAELALTGGSLFFADTSCIKEANANNGKIKRNLVVNSATSALAGLGILASITVEDGNDGKILALDVTGNLRVINKSDFSLYVDFPATQTLLIGKQPYSAVRVVDGANEYFLVTDVVDGKVVKLTKQNGTIVSQDFITGLLAPVKLKVDQGFVYIVESGDVLHNIPNTGKVRKVDLANSANQVILLQNLNNPQGLDIYHNKIVVAEIGNKRVIEASASNPSTPTVIYNNLQSGLSPLVSPLNPVPIESFTGVAVNHHGTRIYVTQNVPNDILLIKR